MHRTLGAAVTTISSKFGAHHIALVLLVFAYLPVGSCWRVHQMDRDEDPEDRSPENLFPVETRPEDQPCGLNPIDMFLARLYEEVVTRVGLSSTNPRYRSLKSPGDKAEDQFRLMKSSYERLLYAFTLLYKNSPSDYYAVMRSIRMWNRCQENQQKLKADVRRSVYVRPSQNDLPTSYS